MPSRQPPDPVTLPSDLSPQHPHHRRHHLQILTPAVIALAVAAVVSIVAAATLAVLLYRRFRRRRAGADDLKPSPITLRRFTYGQLRRATSSFSQSNRLGQGGFGPVFRGSLPSGEDVAVKVMDSGSLQGEREFENELELAAKMAASGSASDRAWVVAPLGFCSSDSRSSRRIRRRRVLIVYQLMHKGSLQDALLGRRCPDLLVWTRRFSIAVDIARGLQFLHVACDPPIIHGDVKPSNVLLDSCLSARISDFGLARIKNGDEALVVDEGDIEKTAGKNEQKELTANGDDEASVMGETAESTTTGGNEIGAATEKSPDDEESRLPGSPLASTSEAGGFDRMSVDSGTASSSRKGARKKGVLAGKDWWWRQDAGPGGNPAIKDYVMEWIRSEIKKERPKSEWITTPVIASEDRLPKPDRKKQQRRLEWWASLDEEKVVRKERSRPAREWWREEFCEELTNKQKRKSSIAESGAGEHKWWQRDEEDSESVSERRKRRRKRKSESRTSIDGQRNSRDWASGDIPKSGTISSTPSMRGTVCYVAPEYGGGGSLSEKCDIYSFGVLLLVIISGRRPLQVTASPMSEFERANLISWARQLAHSGRLLDLVDPLLQAVDKDQALHCITIALLCIQRSPARRPSIKEVVGMLTGQSEPPHLPLEFSPSPPGGFSFKPQKKSRSSPGFGGFNFNEFPPELRLLLPPRAKTLLGRPKKLRILSQVKKKEKKIIQVWTM